MLILKSKPICLIIEVPFNFSYWKETSDLEWRVKICCEKTNIFELLYLSKQELIRYYLLVNIGIWKKVGHFKRNRTSSGLKS